MKKLLVLLLLFIAVSGFKCGTKKDIFDRAPIAFNSARLLWSGATPKGVRLISTTAIPENTYVFIDSGIDDLFRSTAGKNYTSHRNHSDFYVILLPPTSASQDGGCPTLNLKDGLKIAGLALVDFVPNYIVVARNDVEISQYCDGFLRDAVRYEGEHLTAFNNDSELFRQTTGAGDIHPIYPFTDEPPKAFFDTVISAKDFEKRSSQ